MIHPLNTSLTANRYFLYTTFDPNTFLAITNLQKKKKIDQMVTEEELVEDQYFLAKEVLCIMQNI